MQQLPHILSAVFEAAPFGVFIIDAEGIIVSVNPSQCKNSHLTPEDLIGKHYRTTFYTALESHGLLPLWNITGWASTYPFRNRSFFMIP